MTSSHNYTFNVKTMGATPRVHALLTGTALNIIGVISPAPAVVEYTVADLTPSITTIGTTPAVDTVDGVYPEPYSEEMGALLDDCIEVARTLTQFETDLLIYALSEGETITGSDKVDALLEAFAPMSAEDMRYVMEETFGAQMEPWHPETRAWVAEALDAWQEMQFAIRYGDHDWQVLCIDTYYGWLEMLTRAGQFVRQAYDELEHQLRQTLYPTAPAPAPALA